MSPSDPSDRESDETATASDRDTDAGKPTPATPSLAARELALLAGRDLHADRSRR